MGRGGNEVSDRLRKLAEPTGGYAKRSNSVADLVAAALAELESYYLLAYEPPPGTFTNQKLRYRKLEVKVRRKGLTVRTRGGFYSVDDETLVKNWPAAEVTSATRLHIHEAGVGARAWRSPTKEPLGRLN